ncbi:glycosyltransferase family 4 protein [Candidatus Nomurabacteria bacterium]|nr:glycosyltransferase family 4 protein [Candidatus Nomurabacteria bacterium]
MRILFIANRFHPAFGGVEVLTREYSKELVKRGHQVTVFTTDFVDTQGNERFSDAKSDFEGVKVHRFKGIRLIKDPLTLAPGMFVELFKQRKSYDVAMIYTYGYATTWMSSLMKMFGLIRLPFLGLPNYAPNYNFPSWLVSFYDKTLGKIFVKETDVIVIHTRMYEDFFIDMGQEKEALPTLLPIVLPIPYVETDHLLSTRQKYSIPETKKLILCFGRVVEYKGIQFLIKAFAQLLADTPERSRELHLVVAGGGAYQGPLEKLVEELKIINNVTFTGRVSEQDKNSLYRMSDLFCLLSYSGESFGITYVEAMSAGLAILGSNKGAVPFVVKDRFNGYLVDPFNHEIVVQKLKTILIESNLELFKKNNLTDFDKYSPKVVVDLLEKYLNLAVESAKGS